MGREYTRDLSILGNIPKAGPIILQDDFEEHLKWTKGGGAGAGGDAIFELCDTVAYYGNNSLLMQTRTTGTTDGDIIHAERYVPLLPSLKLNMFGLVRMDSSDPVSKYWAFSFLVANGSTHREGKVRYDFANTKWQYLDAPASWVDIPGGAIGFQTYAFNRMALSLDFLNENYISFTWNQHIFSLANIPLSPDSNPNVLQTATLELTTGYLGIPFVWLDNILIHEI